MTRPPLKRRQYLVDPGYQLRVAIRLFAIVLAVAFVGSLLATGILWSSLYQPGLERQTMLAVALIAISLTLLIELLLAIPIVFFFSIRYTHRVVGPIKRINGVLEALGTGDFSQRIRLRQGDVLIPLADSINQMAQRLESRFSKPPGP